MTMIFDPKVNPHGRTANPPRFLKSLEEREIDPGHASSSKGFSKDLVRFPDCNSARSRPPFCHAENAFMWSWEKGRSPLLLERLKLKVEISREKGSFEILLGPIRTFVSDVSTFIS